MFNIYNNDYSDFYPYNDFSQKSLRCSSEDNSNLNSIICCCKPKCNCHNRCCRSACINRPIGPTGPTGATGDTGPTGPTGTIGPTGSAELFGIQVQLTNRAGAPIANNGTVIYDRILNQIGSAILYNNTSGEFTISQNGHYMINWWVSVDGSDETSGLSFSLNKNGATYSQASAPPITSQIVGLSLITIDNAPAIISLTNISRDTIAFEDVPVQANMVIALMSTHIN